MSEVSFVCEIDASIISLWSLVTMEAAFVSILVVGVPVYFAVTTIGRRYGW